MELWQWCVLSYRICLTMVLFRVVQIHMRFEKISNAKIPKQPTKCKHAWPPFCRRDFEMHFPERNLLISNETPMKYLLYGPNWQYTNISSGNGLATSKRQNIDWTNESRFQGDAYIRLRKWNKHSVETYHWRVGLFDWFYLPLLFRQGHTLYNLYTHITVADAACIWCWFLWHNLHLFMIIF